MKKKPLWVVVASVIVIFLIPLTFSCSKSNKSTSSAAVDSVSFYLTMQSNSGFTNDIPIVMGSTSQLEILDQTFMTNVGPGFNGKIYQFEFTNTSTNESVQFAVPIDSFPTIPANKNFYYNDSSTVPLAELCSATEGVNNTVSPLPGIKDSVILNLAIMRYSNNTMDGNFTLIIYVGLDYAQVTLGYFKNVAVKTL
ncbi:MAG TPA: hypothetical protein VKR32_17085 [Puia sp.]|nr:hypothetical protein [Puia sp.]